MTSEMNDTKVIGLTKEGFEILCQWSAMIAKLPLEEWDQAFEKYEAIGFVTDPTQYRDYLYNDKAKFIRKLIQTALPLKQLIMESQPFIVQEILKQAEELIKETKKA